MTLLVTVRLALGTIRMNPLRSGLTALGVIIGVAAVITMVAVGAGAQARVAEQMATLGSNLLVVTPGSASAGGVQLGYGTRPSLTEDDAIAVVREVPLVRSAAPSVYAGNCCRIVYENLNWWTGVQGTLPSYEGIREWSVVRGRYLTTDDNDGAAKVAVIGQTVSSNLFGRREAIGEVVRIGQVPFTVVGLLERKGQNALGKDQDDIVLIPISTAKQRIIGPENPRGETVHAISVKVREGADLKTAERQIRALLRQRHQLSSSQGDDFRVQNLAEALRAEEESTRALTILLGSIASVSLLVGGIGIMNIMLVSVTERTREVGIRMAVGARTGDILAQFLVEAMTLALIGGLIGIALGVSGAHAVSYFAGWRTSVTVEAIVVAFGFSAAVGIFFGLYPARKAAALDPITALRYE
jgi:putative ABC transport system permease protein